MITIPAGLCHFHDCPKDATRLAASIEGRVGMYCKDHFLLVADDDTAEHVVNCPNCKCVFGV